MPGGNRALCADYLYSLALACRVRKPLGLPMRNAGQGPFGDRFTGHFGLAGGSRRRRGDPGNARQPAEGAHTATISRAVSGHPHARAHVRTHVRIKRGSGPCGANCSRRRDRRRHAGGRGRRQSRRTQGGAGSLRRLGLEAHGHQHRVRRRHGAKPDHAHRRSARPRRGPHRQALCRPRRAIAGQDAGQRSGSTAPRIATSPM